MPRYVMASRRAGKFTSSAKKTARAAVDTTFNAFSSSVDVVGDTSPEDEESRRVVVFNADADEISSMVSGLPDDVILEPEILHYPVTSTLMGFPLSANPADSAPAGTGQSADYRIVSDDGSKLKGASVTLYLRGMVPSRTTKLEAETDGYGKVNFEHSSFWTPVMIVVVPAGDHWSMVFRGVTNGATFSCPALPKDGPLGWWHDACGVTSYKKTRGKGIRVGVIDSGISTHPDLSLCKDVGSFIDGVFNPNGGADSGSHGSHVSGCIAARPDRESGSYSGISPGVTLYSARVFPPEQGANQGDIASAIEHLRKNHSVHLINMSLGSPSPSVIEQDAIADALESGTLCVCAAANSSGPVEFPAAFPETVAVSAIGLTAWGPEGSIASMRMPQSENRYGTEGYYLANFSCYGPEIDCAASGVGIISTVPPKQGLDSPYLSMGGTSMASPVACGALAAILAESEDYLASNPDLSRAERARALLRKSSLDIGLHSDYQGRGIPQVP